MENQSVETQENKPAAVPATTPDGLLQLAVQQNFDVEKLSKLMELKEKWDKEQARKDYFYALSKFQMTCPEIKKTKKVLFPTKSGGNMEYHYAPLAEIIKQIIPALKASELTYKWETSQDEDKKLLTIKCRITHINGHSEVNEMTVPFDDSGNKNEIQKRGSAISYAQRYTLCGSLGIGTADEDIDANFKDRGSHNVSQKAPLDQNGFNKLLLSVQKGNRTVEFCKEHYDLSEERVKALREVEPKK